MIDLLISWLLLHCQLVMTWKTCSPWDVSTHRVTCLLLKYACESNQTRSTNYLDRLETHNSDIPQNTACATAKGFFQIKSTKKMKETQWNLAGTGEAAMGAAAVAASASANLEVLRAGLEREAQARVALGSETAEQLKQTPGPKNLEDCSWNIGESLPWKSSLRF